MDSNSKSNVKSIGDIIRQTNSLTTDQVKSILEYQSSHGVRFGEAAVALGLVKESDVLWALSQQFHYPYAATGRDTLGTELVVAKNPFGEAAEEFRSIRANIISNGVSGTRVNKPVFAVVSPQPGEGRSFFVANLATVFSQLGERTLIIDADLRTPRQHKIFESSSGGEADGGLSTVLSGRSAARLIRPVDALPSLYLLPAGVRPPNPMELLHRPAFELLLQELSTKFDHIIIDTPASKTYADARLIAAKTGGALVIGRRNITRMNDLNGVVDGLKRVGAGIVGVALNR